MVEVAQANLMVRGGPNSGMTIPLSGRPVTMGRRADNDVWLDETTVSRRHALILETPTGYALRDLNSTNGTFVNRDRIGTGEHVLTHGDTIKLAGSDVTLIFRHEGPDTQKMGKMEPPPTGAIQLNERPDHVDRDDEPPEPQLQGRDAEILNLLKSQRGGVVSREEIVRLAWPELPGGSAANQLIDDAIDRLRDGIGDDRDSPENLISVGEFGFLLI